MRLTTPNKENIQKLVDELRTTTKRQGRRHLVVRTDSRKKYCCLGIACEVALANGVPLTKTNFRDFVEYSDQDNHGNTYTLPKAVRDFFGFDRFDPELIDESGERDTATGLNDERGYNFKRIADAFERTYLKPTKPE